MTESSEEIAPDLKDGSGPSEVGLQIEVWKKIVDVQQHFNDIGWRIRSLAITALTFTLGATFFGFLNAHPKTIGALTYNPASLVPVLGLFVWWLFWFADGIWYHRLLSGAGKSAGPIEESLKSQHIDAGLSTEITNASHRAWFGVPMTSTRKLHIFYVLGTIILLLAAVSVFLLTFQLAPVIPPTSTPTPSH
ncbi:hypothetical protein [Leifsonia xyli]|uniref:hypothetical protein n=1 Tax=Leifsonia xyli TaxID=1575 RepID=UPI003D66AE94